MQRLFTLIFLFVCAQSFGQSPQQSQLESWTEEYWQHGLNLLTEIVKMPNDAVYTEQIETNIQWCEQQFEARDWSYERLSTGGIPILLAQKINPNANTTILFYFHIDGQAVDRSQWEQPDPYIPVLKEKDESGYWKTIDFQRLQSEYNPDWRVFARSTSDDKGPFAMFLTAWDVLREKENLPDYSVKVILDFEEEQGSPNLPDAVLKYKDKLAADLMLIMDGPRHSSNLPTLTFGARGIAQMTLTTFGPKLPQHSGHYGNYAPNPALLLSQLLASMKDEDGRVSIPGYYDGIELSEQEKVILAAVPDNDEAIQKRLGIGRTDQVGNTYQESIQYPSLNIRGMRSAWVGPEARTIVPATALAEVDIRLVPESDPERLFSLIRKHIEDQGFHIVESDPSDDERLQYPKIVKLESKISYQAFRTPLDSYAGDWLRSAMNRAFGQEPIQIRISGGSIPISPFVDALEVPAVTIPTVNADNNQHSPNENIRLGNYREGIQTILSVLTEPSNK